MTSSERDDRRRYHRVQAPAFVRRAGFFAGATRRVNDISTGGLRMFSDDEHRPGTRLEFELFLPGAQSVEFMAEVVWLERLSADAPARFDVGFKYLDVDRADLERISRVLAVESA